MFGLGWGFWLFSLQRNLSGKQSLEFQRLKPVTGLLEFGLCTNVCDQDAGELPVTRRVNLLQTGVLVKWSGAEFASLSHCGTLHVGARTQCPRSCLSSFSI